jgi:hypothetical protein
VIKGKLPTKKAGPWHLAKITINLIAANLCFEPEVTFIAETDPNLFIDDPNPPPLCPGTSKHIKSFKFE